MSLNHHKGYFTGMAGTMNFTNIISGTDDGFSIFPGNHPKITGLRISSFNQEYPITKQLTEESLTYLTCKNSHPQTDFSKHMRHDPIVFLKLEDVGIGADVAGYPESRRVEFDIEITNYVLPTDFREMTYYRNGQPEFELTVGMVYENHVCEGTNDRMEFRWKN